MTRSSRLVEPKRFLHWFRSGSIWLTINYGTRLAQVAVVLPIVLVRFEDSQTLVWLQIEVFIGLLFIADAGITPTFTRMVAAAVGGSREVRQEDRRTVRLDSPTTLFFGVEGALKRFNMFAVIFGSATLLAVAGLSLVRPVNELVDPRDGWLAFAGLCVATPFMIGANRYIALLQGLGSLWRVNMWRAAANCAASVSLFVATLVADSVALLIWASLSWRIVLWAVLRVSATRQSRLRFGPPIAIPKDQLRQLLAFAWGPSWRSAVGLTTGYTTIQGAGIVFAQLAVAPEAASVLLALRIFEGIKLFAGAPFLSQIPRMSTLYVQNRIDELVRLARSRTWLTLGTAAVAGLLITFVGNPLLESIGARTFLPSKEFLLILTVAIVIERFSNQQMQLQSVTNNIIWHTANVLTTVAFALLAYLNWLLTSNLNIPLSFALSYACVHLPYVILRTPRDLRMLQLRNNWVS